MHRIKQQAQCPFLFSPDNINSATLNTLTVLSVACTVYISHWGTKYYYNIYQHNIFIDLYFHGHNSIQSIRNIFAKTKAENLYY